MWNSNIAVLLVLYLVSSEYLLCLRYSDAQSLVTMPIISLCLGGSHVCAAFNNKRMKCFGSVASWGLSETGNIGDIKSELGDNNPFFDMSSTPSISYIACGLQHTCAVLESGDAKCVGMNVVGQTGNGLNATVVGEVSGHIGDALPVVNLGDGLKVLSVSLANQFSCFLLTGNKVKCVGKNNFGQLGNGNSTDIGTKPSDMGNRLPFIDLGTDAEVVSIHSSAWAFHTCAIFSKPAQYAQRFKCWGRNQANQASAAPVSENIGDNPSDMGDRLPLIDLGIVSTVKQVSAGGSHTCAMLTNDSIKCWGANGNGQLGSGVTTSSVPPSANVPISPIDSGKTVELLRSSYRHTCILYSDYLTMKCFGRNDYGQLGQEDDVTRGNTPTTTIPNIPPVDLGTSTLKISSIFVGQDSNCILFANNGVKCFGANANGQLGIGTSTTVGSKKGDLGRNLRYTAFFTSPTAAPTKSPTLEKSKSTLAISSFCTGSFHSCAVFEKKSVKCFGFVSSWGLAASGNIGDAPEELGDSIPFIDIGEVESIDDIFCGSQHICIIVEYGYIKCMGYNFKGQIGIGSTGLFIGVASGHIGNKLPNVDVGPDLEVYEAALGNQHSCFLITGNKIKCVGWNQYGQLGYGSTTDIGKDSSQLGEYLPFVDLGTNVTVKSIHTSSNGQHTCAIMATPALAENKIKCWGRGTFYRLGYGTIVHKGDAPNEMGDFLPIVDLGMESRVKKMAMSELHSCALLYNDQIKCWGSGQYGQLGLGSSSDVTGTGDNIPIVPYDDGRAIMLISSGSAHTCLVYEDDLTMKCFGYNVAGQLGQGDTLSRGDWPSTTIPNITAIDLGTYYLNIASIHCGMNYNCVVFADSRVKCFGDNSYGQLGIGSTSNVGDKAGEMGENLKYVRLFTVTSSPTVSPTAPPYESPTLSQSELISAIVLPLFAFLLLIVLLVIYWQQKQKRKTKPHRALLPSTEKKEFLIYFSHTNDGSGSGNGMSFVANLSNRSSNNRQTTRSGDPTNSDNPDNADAQVGQTSNPLIINTVYDSVQHIEKLISQRVDEISEGLKTVSGDNAFTVEEIENRIQLSEVIIVLLSKRYFENAMRVIELYMGLELHIPIFIIYSTNSGYEFSSSKELLGNIYLEEAKGKKLSKEIDKMGFDAKVVSKKLLDELPNLATLKYVSYDSEVNGKERVLRLVDYIIRYRGDPSKLSEISKSDIGLKRLADAPGNARSEVLIHSKQILDPVVISDDSETMIVQV